ncbi:Ig-like domain-containing protein [Phormidium sp. FACHB-592]|uniref:Ig-like domain-containing protein n=2 Tax=Cyanobacteriota TaxID=1117 RepID=A0ABV0KQ46_9CYAN|nr:Ig-like domain-containing protein [Phormidium sp. FACHB-592]
MIPQWGSRAINSGDLTLSTERDQNGVPRSQGGRPDIGAVEWVNQAPTATNDSVTFRGRTFTFNPLANDFDPAGQSFTLASYSNPGTGKLTRNIDGTFTYTASSSLPIFFPITTSFSYTIADELGATSTATVIINRR